MKVALTNEQETARINRLHASRAARQIQNAIWWRENGTSNISRRTMRWFALRWRDYAHVPAEMTAWKVNTPKF